MQLPSPWSSTAFLLALLSVPKTLAVPWDNNQEAKTKTPKYFHEPGGSLARSHYDRRFFQDEVPYEEHRVVLRELVRSYLKTLHAKGIETWLAHGTLLGWWWNGAVMPWDYDLDVQVSNHTLQWLGNRMNRTEHLVNITIGEPGKEVQEERRYLLDVNPHHVEIDRGDAMNIIDARWIDMNNGMFIDITGLREREADKPGVWSCKNRHRYRSQDLWPMRTTEFEGVEAKIPYSFEMILRDEYGDKSLVLEQYQGHRWDHDIMEWVKMDEAEKNLRKLEAQRRKKEELEAAGRA